MSNPIADKPLIQVCRWHEKQAELASIRETVFIQEQQVPVELEWDDQDADAWHFLLSLGSKPVATARLLASGQVGRMAVLAQYRHQGHGSALLCAIEQKARQLGLEQLFLHAQTHALGFYQQHGYQTRGEEFQDAGIPHLSMYKHLQS